MKIIIFLTIWIGLILLFSNKVVPDLTSDGGYEPASGVGHPLWSDY